MQATALHPDDLPRIVLRYFNCRGRGQPFRYLFIDACVPFTDERLSIGNLPASLQPHKAQREQGAPYASLPVLRWNGTEVAQTLAIASFLARKLEHYKDEDVEHASYLDMVTACAYLETLHPYGELAALSASHRKTDGKGLARVFAERLLSGPAQLEGLLGSPLAGEIWFGGHEPAVADYMVFTALRVGLDALGEPFAKALEQCPKLARHHAAMLARPRISEYLEAGQEPVRIIDSPHEAEMIELLQAAARA